MRKSSAHFCKAETPPRVEVQGIIQGLVFRSVPHLTRELQLGWLADLITRESGLPISVSTLRRWWDAKPDDRSGIDSRHMDWARARDRSMGANDNQPVRLPWLSIVRAA